MSTLPRARCVNCRWEGHHEDSFGHTDAGERYCSWCGSTNIEDFDMPLKTMSDLIELYGHKPDHPYLLRAFQLLGKPVDIDGKLWGVSTGTVSVLDPSEALPATTPIPAEVLDAVSKAVPNDPDTGKFADGRR